MLNVVNEVKPNVIVVSVTVNAAYLANDVVDDLVDSEADPLPALLGSVFQQLPLCLPVNPQQPRAQGLVQPQEEIPVVVDEEKVVDAVHLLLVFRFRVAQVDFLPGYTGTRLHGRRSWGGRGGACRLARATGGGGGLRVCRLRWAAASPPGLTIELLLGLGLVLGLFNLLICPVFSITELAAAGEEQVGDKVLDDALDVVFVVFVDGGLPFDVVDDERGSVLQDLFVLVRKHHILLKPCWASLHSSSLAFNLQKKTHIIRYTARRWMTSEVPPRQSSNLNRSWSSGERRESFFCTLSSTLMVARGRESLLGGSGGPAGVEEDRDSDGADLTSLVWAGPASLLAAEALPEDAVTAGADALPLTVEVPKNILSASGMLVKLLVLELLDSGACLGQFHQTLLHLFPGTLETKTNCPLISSVSLESTVRPKLQRCRKACKSSSLRRLSSTWAQGVPKPDAAVSCAAPRGQQAMLVGGPGNGFHCSQVVDGKEFFPSTSVPDLNEAFVSPHCHQRYWSCAGPRPPEDIYQGTGLCTGRQEEPYSASRGPWTDEDESEDEEDESEDEE
ncbi:hypothetical protein EYF80_000563 [Liparis tanakae]|uniref:Uncharacterized protein n=1 Tax=Liparis tanakae TaxID=230148 RepID=A0A4Z2JGA1_9TELE|nr:hypothetical protein EYF80_000563 [Liparis tanakae]